MWAPGSGFWRAADGWVRTHANYPHHAARLARLLGLPDEPGRALVERAIAERGAAELEDAAASAGAIVGRVRTRAEWADEPQAAHVAALPLVGLDEDPTGPPGQWGSGDLPLAGVRVLDLTRVLAGPVATRHLAFAGADVLRVDSPRLPETGWVHLDTGAGKRSTMLDLASAADRRTFDDLLGRADVVVTGYRPGALDRYGLAPDALRERRPGIVVGSVSAWGADGPWAGRRGFDSIVQAVTGIAMLQSADGETPGALPAQALDHTAGHLLAAGLTRTLLRQRTQGGSYQVSVALARLAHALLDGPAPTGSSAPGRDTTQTGTTRAGTLTVAAPVLTWAGGPQWYPSLAQPWGTDEPRWVS